MAFRSNRRRFLGGVAGTATAGFVGCLGDESGSDGDVSMDIGSTYEPGHINVEAAELFAERMDEESDGRFEVTVTPGGAYGAEDEIVGLVAEGSPEGFIGGMLPYMMYAEEYYPLVSPFLARDWETHQQIVESDIVQEDAIPQLIEEGNQRVLGNEVYRGVRHFTSNEPIYGPEDVADLDLRLPEIAAWIEVWTEIGADPTSVALDELYSAVETGVVDSTEGDAEQISSFNLAEVQDYLVLTGHRVETGIFTVNEDFFQSLDSTHQQMIEEIALDVTEEASEISLGREDDLIEELGDEMEIIDEPDLSRDAFFEAADPALENLFETRFEADLSEIRQI